MFNSIICASAHQIAAGTIFKSGKMAKADSQGLSPFTLTVSGGTSPNRNILSGTIAKNLGLMDGHTYLLQVREVEPSEEYGRQFIWTVLQEITSAIEIVKVCNELGDAVVFDVETAEVKTDSRQGAV